MADLTKDAKVTVGVEGAEEVARAAQQATEPWKQAGAAVGGAFRQAGGIIGRELASIGKDVVRTVTVMRTLNLSAAVDSARAYREEVARFAVGAGQGVGAVRGQFEKISRATLESEPALAAWAKRVGRLTYDYAGAVQGARALSAEAKDTNRSLEDMSGLGVVLSQALGASGDLEEVLGKVRAQAKALGTVGGVMAFHDQIEALSGTLLELSADTDEARARLTGLVGVLGRGLLPRQAQQVQGAVLGALPRLAPSMELLLGKQYLNEQGEVADPAAMLRDVRGFYYGLTRDPKMRTTMLRGVFGNLGAAAVERGDFSEPTLQKLGALPPSKGAEAGAAAFAETEAGQALSTQLEAARNLREAAMKLVQAGDKWNEWFARHPMAGQAAGGLVQGGVAGILGALGGWFGRAAGGAAPAMPWGALGGKLAAFAANPLALGTGAAVLGGYAGTKAMDAGWNPLAEWLGDAAAGLTGAGAPRGEAVARRADAEEANERAARAAAMVLGDPVNVVLGQGRGPDSLLSELARQLKAGQVDPSRFPRDFGEVVAAALARTTLRVQMVGPAYGPPANPQPAGGAQ